MANLAPSDNITMAGQLSVETNMEVSVAYQAFKGWGGPGGGTFAVLSEVNGVKEVKR